MKESQLEYNSEIAPSVLKRVFWIPKWYRRSGDLWTGICFQKAGLGFSFLSLYVTGNSWNLRNLPANIFPVFPPGISAVMNQLKHSVDEKFCQNTSQRLWASLFAWCRSHMRLSPHAQEWMKKLSWTVWKSIFSTSYQKHVNKDWQYPYRSNSRSVTASGWFLWAALKNSKEAFSQMAYWADCLSELSGWWVWSLEFCVILKLMALDRKQHHEWADKWCWCAFREGLQGCRSYFQHLWYDIKEI